MYYYIDDMLGSSRTIVQDGQTSPCYEADFYPFGGERDLNVSCTQNYKFEGKERDPETQNDDFGARYYSNRFGRWLSADWSSVPEPVPYANLTNPQTLNLYAMVSDNPETFADLDGHWCSVENGCAPQTEWDGAEAWLDNPMNKLPGFHAPADAQDQSEQPSPQSPDLQQQAVQATAAKAQAAKASQDAPPVGSPGYVAKVSGQVTAEMAAGNKVIAGVAIVEGAGVATVVATSVTAEQAATVARTGVKAVDTAVALHQEEVQYGIGVAAALTHSAPPRTAAGAAGYISGKIISYLINTYKDTQ